MRKDSSLGETVGILFKLQAPIIHEGPDRLSSFKLSKFHEDCQTDNAEKVCQTERDRTLSETPEPEESQTDPERPTELRDKAN